MPLASLPEAFGLPAVAKGYFPHLFNTVENENYDGCMPPADTYSPNTMSSKGREKFFEWYNDQVENNYRFIFKDEIVKYCKEDVKILRLACLKFRELFMKHEVDPFGDCTTIASSCMRVYRKKFLKEEQIGIIPSGGYRRADKQSVKALVWLRWMEERVLHRPIQHAGNGREKRLDEGFLVDGYCEPVLWGDGAEDHKGIVLQYQGCYHHSCPRCYRVNRDKILANGESMDQRYERTCAVNEKLRHHHYHLIEMWECDYDAALKQDVEMRNFAREVTESLRKDEPLDARDAFFGGRTGNNVKLYDCKDGEKIRYADVCSLYPYICKWGRYPVGHPKIYSNEIECRQLVGDNNDVSRVDGLIKCNVLPPQNLYHAVLPVRMHGKLIFPLCRTCCELQSQEDCEHEAPEERELRGTWVSEELKKAVELGYKVLKVCEIWQCQTTQYNPETRTGGLFATYIDEFFKLKTAASGFPSDCTTDEDKRVFLEKLEQVEGIQLNADDVSFNAGMRSMTKLCLNSLWGKISQRNNMAQTEVIHDVKKLFDLLTNPDVVLTSILPVNDETLYANWYYEDNALQASYTTNVVVAAFTTAQARLKLFEHLHKLGARVLYHDTDSVIYVTRGAEADLPTGSMLGELTDELAKYGPDTYIESFISGGPKFYGFRYRTPCEVGLEDKVGYVQKVKGIKLNHENSERVNFDSIREMICGETSEILLTNTAIRRTCFHDVVTQTETKTCKPVYTKRRFVGLSESYPYGYKSGGN